MHFRIRTSLGTLLASLTLFGCSTHQPRNDVSAPASPYCLRGGNAESFSCDPDLRAAVEPLKEAPKTAARVQDDALYAELAEIKSWLNSEKDAYAENTSPSDESDVVLAPPVPPEPVAEPLPAPPLPALQADAQYRQVLEHAAALHQQGFYQHARAELEQLIQLYPYRPEAYNNLGVMLAESREYSAAIEQLKQALATHPHYARIHSNLRSLYAALAGNTYSDALGLRRNRPAPRLETLDATIDADDISGITGAIGKRLEYWALSPSLGADLRSAQYIAGFRPDSKTTHAQWLQSLTVTKAPLQLQAYELAVKTPDWVEVTLLAGLEPAPGSKRIQRSLTLIRFGTDWLISAEHDPD